MCFFVPNTLAVDSLLICKAFQVETIIFDLALYRINFLWLQLKISSLI
ncbi:MAG: hypothetical protein RLY16_1007 [Bacteroidota bacterium]